MRPMTPGQERCIRPATVFLAVAGMTLSGMAMRLSACPFCTAVSQTFSEEIQAVDVAVIARLQQLPGGPARSTQSSAQASTARFAVEQVLKGPEEAGQIRQVRCTFLGDGRLGDSFLLMGTDPPRLTWAAPLRLNDRQRDYLRKLPSLPARGAGRLAFFQRYLEDSDSMLSRDAYDEFARAPYSEVQDLRPQMDHEILVAWIKDPNIPASRRRLYLTMLGACGNKDDLEWITPMLQSAHGRSALDALIACYLTLRGPQGVPVVEQMFLESNKTNFADNYADTYAAIMALRFHGTEGDPIPRQRVLKSFHLVLDRPAMADLVIADLARWQDWSQVKRLTELFKTTDPKKSWVRAPIVSYLMACPLPEASQAIKELAQIDPDAVARARALQRAFAPRPKQDAGKK